MWQNAEERGHRGESSKRTTELSTRHDDDYDDGAKNFVDIVTEFHHIQVWATANKLCINTKKTKEIVLHQPRARSQYIPLSI